MLQIKKKNVPLFFYSVFEMTLIVTLKFLIGGLTPNLRKVN